MKSIKKNFVYNILLNISQVIYPLITAPYIARVLDPESLGLANFASTYAGYFALFAVLGLPTYGVRAVASVRDNKGETSELVSSLFSLSVLTTVIVTGLYLLSIAFIGSLRVDYLIFIVSGAAIYLAPIKINWYYQGIEDFGFITLRTLIIRTLSLVAIFLFVKTRDDLLIYVLIGVLGSVVGDIWNYIRLLKSGIKVNFSLKGTKEHLKPVTTLFFSSIAISIYTILDTLMLGFMSEYSEVGYYGNAMHLSKAALALVTSLSVVVVPRVSHYFAQGKTDEVVTLVNKAISFVSFIAFPCAIGLACVAPTFVPLFFGDKFLGSIIPVQILSFLIVALGLNNLLGFQCLIGLGKDRLFLNVVLIGAAANLVLNLIMIPIWGSIGASISSVFAELLILLIEVFIVYKHTFIRFSAKLSKEVIISLLLSAGFIPIVLGLNKVFTGWIFIGISVLCCGVFYLIGQFIFKNSSLEIMQTVLLSKLNIKSNINK